MMRQLMNALMGYFERVPDALRARRLLVWSSFVALTVFLALGVGRARFDMSIEGWFDRDDPTIVAFDWFHHDFGSDDHLYVVYKPRDGDVFSEQSLKLLQRLQGELQGRIDRLREGDTSALRHVVKITSLINAPVLQARDGALVSKKLVGAAVPDSEPALARIRRTAEAQPQFPLLYFSKDHRYGGILIETDFGAIPLDAAPAATAQPAAMALDINAMTAASGPAVRPRFKPTDLADYVALMDEVDAVLQQPEYRAHFTYYPVGSTAAAEYNMATVNEMGMLNLAALVIIMLLLALMFRSLSAVVWPVVIVVLSSVWAIGITGWLGLPITAFVMVAIMLTLACGVADTVHVMSAYLSARGEGREHRAALRHGLRHVAVACLLTTVTNIVAVMALSITPIVPIQVFAFMCALGVGLPFVFSVYLLPLMLDLWAPAPVAQKQRLLARLPDSAAMLGRLLARVLPLVEKGPVAIIALFLALFLTCLYGATRTQVDTDPVGSFPEEWGIRQSVRVVDRHMMGAQSMEIYLDLGRENAFHDPFVLHTVEGLQRLIERKHPGLVVRTTSLVDTVKDSYRTLNDGRNAMYVIPPTQSAVSQTLFLFNQSNPDDRRKLVSDNYDRSHVSVRLYNRGSYEYARAWESMRTDIDKAVAKLRHRYPEAKVAITGMLPLMMQGADALSTSELQSFGLALVLISTLLLVLFGSVKAGVIALLPNLIPAILAYGALGLLDRPLDITTMMIAPIIIGIAVDDTVHFITRYRNEVVLDGDIRRALAATLAEAGQSVVFTTAILGLGFGVMAFASDSGAANLGIFGSLAILVGLLNDLFLLPALILVFKLRFTTRPADEPALPSLEPSRPG
ncbi:MMPL family transporter [Chitiniphilus purpureus]|uniref:MMPL family transporter n=1 Tax=Chitiniphilus purpureus TaxID=2981137 RepID=A0ABY6DP51_9NEIS|nr:MMPL family transporter [Chitiniphilus sp. CD1]UXY16140.1 MMPL family transporter [Chitiniphilus sp. CD1]